MEKLNNFKLAGKCVYVRATTGTVRVGAQAKVQSAEEVVRAMPKGARRQFRKALRRCGHAGLAFRTVVAVA